MKKTAEAVSLGHPDKTADFISSYILDKMIEQDNNIKYAVEVMIKDNNIILGGEIKGNVDLSNLKKYAIDALFEIGYTESYSDIWKDWAINPKKINLINLIGQQSSEINKGVEENGWGDQGVFVGYACKGEKFINYELYLAKKLNDELYKKAKKSNNLGLDIKTQITINEKKEIETAIVAIPMIKYEDLKDFIIETLGSKPKQIIINGTGIYKIHSSIADCGITGRKLACDFYSIASPIGGGSPWTKDGSKADLTLNIYARYLAIKYLKDNDEVFVCLSSCIGKSRLPSATLKTLKNGKEKFSDIDIKLNPKQLIKKFNLDKPSYANLCKNGIGMIDFL